MIIVACITKEWYFELMINVGFYAFVSLGFLRDTSKLLQLNSVVEKGCD